MPSEGTWHALEVHALEMQCLSASDTESQSIGLLQTEANSHSITYWLA